MNGCCSRSITAPLTGPNSSLKNSATVAAISAAVWAANGVLLRDPLKPALPALERFLTTQGRRKFLRPLYEDLLGTDWGKPVAKRIYTKARPTYHAVARSTLDAIVGK